jgi:hypothetical protein
MALQKALVYTTSNGKNFPDHKSAAAEQATIDRTARLTALLLEEETVTGDIFSSEDIATLAAALVRIAPQLLGVLTLPSGRGPNKPKAPAAAAAA